MDDNIDPDLNYHLYANNEENCNYYALDQYQNTLNPDATLNIINYNIRSFNRNFDAFASAFLVNGAPDVLCLTETWFSSDNTIDLPGFHGFHITRDRRSRSVSLYIKNQYDATCVDELSYSNPTREVCTVDVKVNNFNGTFIAIYRPHSDTVSNLCDELATLLENIILRNKCIVIMGDLNICLLKNESPIIDYCNFLHSNHFIPVIDKPTHSSQIDGVAPTLLDHTCINKFILIPVG